MLRNPLGNAWEYTRRTPLPAYRVRGETGRGNAGLFCSSQRARVRDELGRQALPGFPAVIPRCRVRRERYRSGYRPAGRPAAWREGLSGERAGERGDLFTLPDPRPVSEKPVLPGDGEPSLHHLQPSDPSKPDLYSTRLESPSFRAIIKSSFSGAKHGAL